MQIRIGCTTFNGSATNQFANTVNIDGSKRIGNIDTFSAVFVKNSAGIVTAHTQSCLGQVICTKTEECGRFCNFFSHQGCARQFNHGTDQVVNFLAFFSKDFLSCRINNSLNNVQLLLGTDQRNFDFRRNFNTGFLAFQCGFQNSTGLHFGNFRIGNGQTAATVTKHRVSFVQSIGAILNLFQSHTHLVSQFLHFGISVRQEFVQRRIKQTNRYRQTVHNFEQVFEILLLVRQQTSQSLTAAFFVLRQNHGAHIRNSVSIKEHMFCTSQTDTFGTKIASCLSVFRCFGVSANTHGADFVNPAHQLTEVTAVCISFNCRNLAFDNLAFSTIQRYPVTFVNNNAGLGCHCLFGIINCNVGRTGNARCTQPREKSYRRGL